MHNYHIMHKAFLACTIIGSIPSVLGCLLCPSQQENMAGASMSESEHLTARVGSTIVRWLVKEGNCAEGRKGGKGPAYDCLHLSTLAMALSFIAFYLKTMFLLSTSLIYQ